MSKFRKITALVILGALAGAAYVSGAANHVIHVAGERFAAAKAAKEKKTAEKSPLAPAVSVITATQKDFVETVLVTGSLVPRDEILVAPEIEGMRVLDLKVDEGDRVKEGQVLATLVANSLDALIAESDAQLARANAAIAQAKSQIAEAEARATESAAALSRSKTLRKKGWVAESALDQSEAAARSNAAQVTAARDGLKLAQAEKAQVEARRRDLDWKRGNVEVKSPADGLVSRRTARIGGMAVAAGEPMFRIIARGEIELDAEVPETRLYKLAADQPAKVTVSGAGTVEGKVRLVSPEVDKASRLGRVRILLGDDPQLRIGAFARGYVETAQSRAISVPQSAVLYGEEGAHVQVVKDGAVHEQPITVGLSADSSVEVKSGLAEGDVVVAKAGTFLRDGDAVRPMFPDAKVSADTSGAER